MTDLKTDKQLLQDSAELTNDLWRWTFVATCALLAGILIVGLVAKKDTVIQEGLIGTIVGLWYGALCGRSGFGFTSFKAFRESDHELARIKASAASTLPTTTPPLSRPSGAQSVPDAGA